MHVRFANPAQSSLGILQRFVRRPRDSEELCQLCAAPLATEHPHLFELDRRRITCACQPCAILFINDTRQRYRCIPREVYRLDAFRMEDQEWDSLLIPIKLAFFVHNSTAGRVVAQYPSPGGAMESLLDLDYWSVIVERNPMLKRFAPDVEALLVNRLSEAPLYYRAPIDHCYRLAGIIRTHWHGLSGGPEVWKQVDEFFNRLRIASGGHCA
jgi:Family of unknown function (DUF5947)